MTDFIVERVIEPILAWQYDGTGPQLLGEDLSSWPVWLQTNRERLWFSMTQLFYRGDPARSVPVHKGHWLVLDGSELFHFSSKADFEKRYRKVWSPAEIGVCLDCGGSRGEEHASHCSARGEIR